MSTTSWTATALHALLLLAVSTQSSSSSSSSSINSLAELKTTLLAVSPTSPAGTTLFRVEATLALSESLQGKGCTLDGSDEVSLVHIPDRQAGELTNVTLRRGRSLVAESGGALTLGKSAAATLSACSFSSNQAKKGLGASDLGFAGGVAMPNKGQATFTACLFFANTGDLDPSQLNSLTASALTVDRSSTVSASACSFVANAREFGATYRGAGAVVLRSTTTGTFTRCSFASNAAKDNGGAQAVQETRYGWGAAVGMKALATGTFLHTSFQHNGDKERWGIAVASATATFTACTVNTTSFTAGLAEITLQEVVFVDASHVQIADGSSIVIESVTIRNCPLVESSGALTRVDIQNMSFVGTNVSAFTEKLNKNELCTSQGSGDDEFCVASLGKSCGFPCDVPGTYPVKAMTCTPRAMSQKPGFAGEHACADSFCAPGHHLALGGGGGGGGGGASQWRCEPCVEAGTFCGPNVLAAANCSAGYFCPNTSAQVPCPDSHVSGLFCGGALRRSAPALCPAGFFCLSSTEVSPCQASDYCPPQTRTPLPCPMGHWCASPAAKAPCPVGRSSDLTGQTSPATCRLCAKGQYSDAQGAASCLDCRQGFYCPGGSPQPCHNASSYCPGGSQLPLAPDSGHYTVAEAASGRRVSQTVCPVGFKCVAGAKLPCVDEWCPLGSALPTKCPLGKVPLRDGTGCFDCPATGADCSSGALRLVPGFWRADPSAQVTAASVMYPCMRAEFCIVVERSGSDLLGAGAGAGAGAGLNSSTSTMTSTTTGCVPHHAGPLCGLCEAGFVMTASNGCQKCPSKATSAFYVVIGSVIVIGGVCYLIVESNQGAKTNVQIWIRLLTNFLTVASALGAFRTKLPELYRQVVVEPAEAASTGFAIDSHTFQCAIDMSYTQRFYLSQAIPLIILVVPAVVLAAVVARRRWLVERRGGNSVGGSMRNVLGGSDTDGLERQQAAVGSESQSQGRTLSSSSSSCGEKGQDEEQGEKGPSEGARAGGGTLDKRIGTSTSLKTQLTEFEASAVDKYTSTVVLFLFLVHSSVAKDALGTFRCHGETVEGQDFLDMRADTPCQDSARWAVASLGILAWAIGIPCVCFAVLYRLRHSLQDKHVLEEWGFVYGGYLPEYWAWEFVVLARKVLVIFATVYFSDPVVASFVVAISLMLFLMLHISYHPYRSRVFDRLEEVSLFTSVLTQLFTTMYGNYSTGEHDTLFTVVLILLNLVCLGCFVYVGVKAFKADGWCNSAAGPGIFLAKVQRTEFGALGGSDSADLAGVVGGGEAEAAGSRPSPSPPRKNRVKVLPLSHLTTTKVYPFRSTSSTTGAEEKDGASTSAALALGVVGPASMAHATRYESSGGGGGGGGGSGGRTETEAEAAQLVAGLHDQIHDLTAALAQANDEAQRTTHEKGVTMAAVEDAAAEASAAAAAKQQRIMALEEEVATLTAALAKAEEAARQAAEEKETATEAAKTVVADADSEASAVAAAKQQRIVALEEEVAALTAALAKAEEAARQAVEAKETAAAAAATVAKAASADIAAEHEKAARQNEKMALLESRVVQLESEIGELRAALASAEERAGQIRRLDRSEAEASAALRAADRRELAAVRVQSMLRGALLRNVSANGAELRAQLKSKRRASIAASLRAMDVAKSRRILQDDSAEYAARRKQLEEEEQRKREIFALRTLDKRWVAVLKADSKDKRVMLLPRPQMLGHVRNLFRTIDVEAEHTDDADGKLCKNDLVFVLEQRMMRRSDGGTGRTNHEIAEEMMGMMLRAVGSKCGGDGIHVGEEQFCAFFVRIAERRTTTSTI